MRQDDTGEGQQTRHLRSAFSIGSGRDPSGRSFLEGLNFQSVNLESTFPRQALIGLLLVLALLAFEIFNFDTTQYALGDFLGEARFMSIRWATILAVAFCSIDFAGLAYLFGTDQETGQNREVWYLIGAWLLGATMNALMTWWAVSITLLGHEFGNEVMSREDLLYIVPVFVALLVWLTRILFIGALSVAGNHLFGTTSGKDHIGRQSPPGPTSKSSSQPARHLPMPRTAMAARSRR